MHCSVIEHGYDVIEFSNCSTEERGVGDFRNFYGILKLSNGEPRWRRDELVKRPVM